MRTIAILAALFMAAARRSDGQHLARWRGCYSLAWPDSLEGHEFPRLVRFESQRDTLMRSPPFPRLFVVSGPSIRADSTGRYVRLAQTWWRPVGHDSVHLTVVDSYNIQWDVDLGQDGDSLVGDAQGMDGDAAYGPVFLSGRRRPCR
jgi:hypothetical protein